MFYNNVLIYLLIVFIVIFIFYILLNKNVENLSISVSEQFDSTEALKIPIDRIDDYKKYLKSQDWKLLRKLVIKRDKYRCVRCGYIGYLQVHHTNYRGIYTMNFSIEQLESVCDVCHKEIHAGKLSMIK